MILLSRGAKLGLGTQAGGTGQRNQIKRQSIFFFPVVLLQEKRCWNKVWDSTHLKESVGWRLELGSRHEDVERGR
jgi:hypothetical protein